MSLNRLVAISLDSGVEEGALHAAEILKRSGFKTQLFLTSGQTDSHWERAILHNPSIEAVLEFSLSELSSTQLGLSGRLTPDRLTSAAMRGIPQVIIPGSLDHGVLHNPEYMVAGRRHISVDENTRLVRTSCEDNDYFGKQVAFKASASTGKVCCVIPRGGFSKWDGQRMPAEDLQANQVFLDSLLLWKSPHVEVVESHRHINDPHFAQIAVDQLLKLLVVR